MTTQQALKEQARANARSILAQSHGFREMQQSEQMAVYQDTVNSQYRELARQQGFSEGMAAKDLIDDSRHLNSRIGDAGDLAGDFIQSVDFPQFVEDLLEGVFDANLNVTLKQMESYQELLRSATASLSKFVNEIDDTEAMQRLATDSDDFGFGGDEDFGFGDDDFGAVFSEDGGQQGPTLIDRNGNPVDVNQPSIKARILDTKLAMAKERRSLLRESILMGVSRLVVEKGTVKAAVVFDIKASENISKKDLAKERVKERNNSTSGGGFFGFYSNRSNSSRRKAQLSVSSVKSASTTDLQAQITGSVEINFKSDYFKLDNFAQMFDLGKGQIAQNPNQAGGQPQQLPGGQVPPQQPGQQPFPNQGQPFG